jgi:hypothetical protein
VSGANEQNKVVGNVIKICAALGWDPYHCPAVLIDTSVLSVLSPLLAEALFTYLKLFSHFYSNIYALH